MDVGMLVVGLPLAIALADGREVPAGASGCRDPRGFQRGPQDEADAAPAPRKFSQSIAEDESR